MKNRNWIGVDLDGTLAEYHGWEGHEHIGPPVPKMLERVLKWIEEGKTVKIVTARVYPGNFHASKSRVVINKWIEKHVGFPLQVTCLKDPHMIELWDDRAIQVIPNTGEPVRENQGESEKPRKRRRSR